MAREPIDQKTLRQAQGGTNLGNPMSTESARLTLRLFDAHRDRLSAELPEGIQLGVPEESTRRLKDFPGLG